MLSNAKMLLAIPVLLTLQAGSALAANPYNLDDRCMPFYQEYAAATDGPKAFVAAKNGRCGSWHGAPSAQEAQAKAMELCKSYGGTKCRLVEHVDQ